MAQQSSSSSQSPRCGQFRKCIHKQLESHLERTTPKRHNRSNFLSPLCNHYAVSIQYILSKIPYEHIVNNASQLSSSYSQHVERMRKYEACFLISDLKTRLLVDRHHEGILSNLYHYSNDTSESRKSSNQ